MYLILVRHSRPEMDPARPAREWRLSEEGRDLCLPLAEKLAPFQPGIILSSIEPKARETADLLAQHWHKSAQVEEGLHEHERGNEPYLPSPEEFQTRIQKLFRHPHQHIFGGETASQALARYTNAIHRVVTAHPEQNILLVSHGTVMSLFVAQYNPLDGYEFWRKLNTPDWVVLALPDFSRVTLET